MHILGKLWRTSTFRLTAIFVMLFIGFAVLLLGYITYQSSIQIQRQQSNDIDREIRQIQNVDTNRGFRATIVTVERLARQPGPGLYYLGDPTGQMIVGNLNDFPLDILKDEGSYTFDYDRPKPLDTDDPNILPAPKGNAFVRSVVLDSGLRLIVGRDVVERRGLTGIIFQTFLFGAIGILVLSLVAGALTARRVLRRIDVISATSSKIMSGNLSERVPVTKRNDEFDGLATNLNAMLDRIEQLMQGLKEVTDNVAHDLKTPLTRLRNQAEAALRDSAGAEAKDQALETTIAESDKLIRTFNALLMIARAEAGTPSAAFADVDISAVVADMAELYAPLAEDDDMVLDADISPAIHMRASRELIGQAVVNLLENALKYGRPEDGRPGRIGLSLHKADGRVTIAVSDTGQGIPTEDRQRVTERFVRLEKSRTEPGSGLGLSLVSAVARLHHGSFRIEDNAPGVRAVMDLPAE